MRRKTIKTLVYDCEILGDPTILGWENYEELGITVIGTWQDGQLIAYDMGDPFYLDIFQEAIYSAQKIIGFNNHQFDDPLLAAHGIEFPKNCKNIDILADIRELSGQPRRYVRGVTRRGYDLNSVANANGLGQKSGSGAQAPTLWKAGKHQEVIDYCLNDVNLTRRIYEIMQRRELRDPTTGKKLYTTLNQS